MPEASSAFVLLYATVLMMAFIGIGIITATVLAISALIRRIRGKHEVGK